MIPWLAERICFFYRPEFTPHQYPERILILAPGNLRTAIAVLSPLSYVMDEYPSCEFLLVVSPDAISLLQTIDPRVTITPWVGNCSSKHYRADSEAFRFWSSFDPDWVIATTPNCARLANRFEAPIKMGYCFGPIDENRRSGWLTYSSRRSEGWRSWFSKIPGNITAEYPAMLAPPFEEIDRAELEWESPHGNRIMLLTDTGKKNIHFWQGLNDRLLFDGFNPILHTDISNDRSDNEVDEKSLLVTRKPLNLIESFALCCTADVCITGTETTGVLAAISGTPTGRFDNLGGLWEGDRSYPLVYRAELEADIATAVTYIQGIIPQPSPLDEDPSQLNISSRFALNDDFE